jgi:hypothetical protein
MDSTQPISTTAKGPASAAAEAVPPAAAGGVTQASIVKKTAPKSDYKPADVSPQRRVQLLRCARGRAALRARMVLRKFADMFLCYIRCGRDRLWRVEVSEIRRRT